MVIMVNDVDTSLLTVAKSKNNQYLQLGMNKIQIQTPWITLPRFPLTGKNFVKATDESVALNIPIAEDSDLYKFFTEVDNYLSGKMLMPNKTLHKLVSTKEGQHSVKFKLYLNTPVFVEKVEKKLLNIYDFYEYLQEGREVRIIFNFTKLWTLNNTYGFSIRAEKLQLKEMQMQKSVLDRINEADFGD